MTNTQIIERECIENKLFTAEQLAKMAEIPVHTYQYWKSIGYQVRKGEKAAIKTKLWKQTAVKDSNGNITANKMILATAALFTWLQVDKIEAETEKSAQKKTSSAEDPRVAESRNKIAETKVTLVKTSSADSKSAQEKTSSAPETPDENKPEKKDIKILGEEKSCNELAKLIETIPERYILTFTHQINDTCGAIEVLNMKKTFPLEYHKMDCLAKYVDKAIGENPAAIRAHITGFLIDEIQRAKNYRKPNHAKIAALKNNLLRISAA